MIRKNNLAIIPMLTLLTVTAFAQQKNADHFKLSGDIAAHASGKAYLYYEQHDTIRMDSTDVSGGKFHIAGQISGPVFARLVFSPSSLISTRPAILSFFLEPGLVNIASPDTLKNVTITGSKSDQDFLHIREDLIRYTAKLSVLNQRARAYQAAKDTAGIKSVRRKMDEMEAALRNDTYRTFAEKHPGSPVSIYAINQVAGSYLNSEEIEPLFNNLSPQVRNSTAGRKFAQKIQSAKASSQGGYLPDFSQPDTSGKLVRLSSFKGKYVLVDFWASWCLPCREESPNLVKAFHAYKDSGFTILGVSLDKNKESWLKAIHTDQLSWTQVSDLKYWNNEAAKKFDIRFIPQNILLDPSGKVIGRNLRVDKLNEILDNLFR